MIAGFQSQKKSQEGMDRKRGANGKLGRSLHNRRSRDSDSSTGSLGGAAVHAKMS